MMSDKWNSYHMKCILAMMKISETHIAIISVWYYFLINGCHGEDFSVWMLHEIC